MSLTSRQTSYYRGQQRSGPMVQYHYCPLEEVGLEHLQPCHHARSDAKLFQQAHRSYLELPKDKFSAATLSARLSGKFADGDIPKMMLCSIQEILQPSVPFPLDCRTMRAGAKLADGCIFDNSTDSKIRTFLFLSGHFSFAEMIWRRLN